MSSNPSSGPPTAYPPGDPQPGVQTQPATAATSTAYAPTDQPPYVPPGLLPTSASSGAVPAEPSFPQLNVAPRSHTGYSPQEDYYPPMGSYPPAPPFHQATPQGPPSGWGYSHQAQDPPQWPGGFVPQQTHDHGSFAMPMPNVFQQPSAVSPPFQASTPFAEPVVWYLGTLAPNPLCQNPDAVTAFAQGFDAQFVADKLRGATKGLGANQDRVIALVAPLTALQIYSVDRCYQARYGKTLVDLFEGEFRRLHSNFCKVLHTLALGPVGADAYFVHKSVDGAGTNEDMLIELIMGRSNADLRLVQQVYRQHYNVDMTQKVSSDLSGKTEQLFTMALSASRSEERVVDMHLVEKDVISLDYANRKLTDAEKTTICHILVNRSDAHLREIIKLFKSKHGDLSKAVKNRFTFSDHMKRAPLYILMGVEHHEEGPSTGAWRDAEMLENSMKGLGTKDDLLIMRVVRAHWDRNHMKAVKNMYQAKYKKTLESRISGETSGSYQKLLLALIKE